MPLRFEGVGLPGSSMGGPIPYKVGIAPDGVEGGLGGSVGGVLGRGGELVIVRSAPYDDYFLEAVPRTGGGEGVKKVWVRNFFYKQLAADV